MADKQDYYEVFDRLHGDGRINPVPEHVMDVKTREGLEEARTLVNHAIREKWVTGAALARRIGVKPNVVTDFKNNTWGKRKAGLELTTGSELAKVINAIMRERQADETRIGGFVSTRLAQAIFDIAQYAVKRREMDVFLVPAGFGKSMALEALLLDTPGSILITVRRARGTVKSFFQLLARALKLDETGRAEDIQDRIINCLVGSSRLLLIDEAHKLSVGALDALREVWDEARVPMILAATPTLYQTIIARRVGTHQSELMDQFYSRVGVFRDLSSLENPETGEPERLVSITDIRKVFARGHVRLAKDGTDFLHRLANTTGAGGLRVCRSLVQMVADFWPGETVTAALLGKALETRLGVKEAGFRADQAEIEQQQAAASA